MGQEIERKFLVRSDDWRALADEGTPLRQGYLAADAERSIRVRLADENATLTIKGKTRGMARSEFEYAIPAADAAALLDELCLRPLIEKVRYRVPVGGLVWEVDVFSGDNAGLVVAEVELASEDQTPQIPAWAGAEVTHDPRYYNANLIRTPYSQWAEKV